MGDFDFDAALRWFRFDPGKSLSRRADDALPFVAREPGAGASLLLDTCVYIDQLQNRTPDSLNGLFRARHLCHSTVAIQELAHTIGVLDPKDRRTSGVVRQISTLIKAMPPHRTFVPDADTLARAALLAGLLCRLQGYAKDRRMKAISDCVLLLQAQKHGLVVLTRNIIDFDYMLQIRPQGRVLFYRQA